jgi:hypothetical protein
MKKNKIKNNKIKQLLLIASLMNFSTFIMGNESEVSTIHNDRYLSLDNSLSDNQKKNIYDVSTEDRYFSENSNKNSTINNKNKQSPLNQKRKKNSKPMKLTIAAIGGIATAAGAFGIHRYIKGRTGNEKKDELPTTKKVVTHQVLKQKPFQLKSSEQGISGVLDSSSRAGALSQAKTSELGSSQQIISDLSASEQKIDEYANKIKSMQINLDQILSNYNQINWDDTISFNQKKNMIDNTLNQINQEYSLIDNPNNPVILEIKQKILTVNNMIQEQEKILNGKDLLSFIGPEEIEIINKKNQNKLNNYKIISNLAKERIIKKMNLKSENEILYTDKNQLPITLKGYINHFNNFILQSNNKNFNPKILEGSFYLGPKVDKHYPDPEKQYNPMQIQDNLYLLMALYNQFTYNHDVDNIIKFDKGFNEMSNAVKVYRDLITFDGSTLSIKIKDEIKKIVIMNKEGIYKTDLNPDEIIILKSLKQENIIGTNRFISYIRCKDIDMINMINLKEAIFNGYNYKELDNV